MMEGGGVKQAGATTLAVTQSPAFHFPRTSRRHMHLEQPRSCSERLSVRMRLHFDTPPVLLATSGWRWGHRGRHRPKPVANTHFALNYTGLELNYTGLELNYTGLNYTGLKLNYTGLELNYTGL
jgi:hypothetical protein